MKEKCSLEACKKRLLLSDVSCRCKLRFCSVHRLAEDHKCVYDYKKDGKAYLSTILVHVAAQKVEAI